jgi:hypothetical protein
MHTHPRAADLYLRFTSTEISVLAASLLKCKNSYASRSKHAARDC